MKWGEPTEVLTVRVPASVKKRLEQQALDINRPVAEVVVRQLGYETRMVETHITDAHALTPNGRDVRVTFPVTDVARFEREMCFHPDPVRDTDGLFCPRCETYLD